MASFFTSPASFRVNNMFDNPALPPALMAQNPFEIFKKKPHDSHPSLPHLVLLVFEAVMEVVCVALPGYIIARLGHFDAEKQKFLANLNIQLFTPCLIFTKLASQLNADKLVDLGIIPVIFVIMTFVSYMVGLGVTKAFGFGRRPANFVIAMGVFGNSNSLPISLVISLSQTISGLHWDRIKGDNDDEVAARGILYLLVFQQLGQLVRWSWGYHVLLAPKDKYEEYNQEQAEAGRLRSGSVDGDSVSERRGLLENGSIHESEPGVMNSDDEGTMHTDSDSYVPAGRTPIANHSRASPADTDDDDSDGSRRPSSAPGGRKSRKTSKHGNAGPRNHSIGPGPTNGHIPQPHENGDDLHIQSFPRIRNNDEQDMSGRVKGLKTRVAMLKRKSTNSIKAFGSRQFSRLPVTMQRGFRMLGRGLEKANVFLWEFMNPPLWAMLLAIVVASIPSLQRLFFEEGSF
ncbi:auxin Efflux Carrier superfamily, partial [Pyricularia oryzae Y34]